ncbi:MAG: VOC family protein [Fimbriimonadaceae bacterium]|nr:VOC family protein [Fimbriimonadaceae bacterium]
MSENTNAQIMPMLQVDSVDQARAFYVDVLGFDHYMGIVAEDGQLDFVSVHLGGGKIMLTRAEKPLNGATPPVQLYFQVADVNAYHETIKAKGIEVSPLEDMWWGDRLFIVTDPSGYKLWFYQTVAEPAPPEGMKIV